MFFTQLNLQFIFLKPRLPEDFNSYLNAFKSELLQFSLGTRLLVYVMIITIYFVVECTLLYSI